MVVTSMGNERYLLCTFYGVLRQPFLETCSSSLGISSLLFEASKEMLKRGWLGRLSLFNASKAQV